MKILIGLLGMWCFWNAIRCSDQIGHAIVYGEDQTLYWAGTALFLFGTIGCIIALLGPKK